MAAYSPSARLLDAQGTPVRVVAIAAERNLFQVLDVPAVAGRTFDGADGADVVVVSARFAGTRFGSAAGALGRTIVLDGSSFTVIGVMGDAFQFPYATSRLPGSEPGSRIDLWVPWDPPAGMAANRRLRLDGVVVRIRPDAALATAQRELETIVARIGSAFPDTDAGRGVLLTPLTELITGAARPALFALMGAVALVLLVACANVANLLLVRATLRGREIAVRAALGAGRSRLVRQLLTESFVLWICGSALGLAVVAWGTPLLLRTAAEKIPRAWEIGVDWRVFTFVAIITAVTGFAFGLVPALAAARHDIIGTLRGGTAAADGSHRPRLRDALAIGEVALAFMLLIGSGLLIREFIRLQQTAIGITAPHVLTLHLSPALTPAQYRDLTERAAALPGVRAAAFAQMLPLQNWGWTGGFAIRGFAMRADEQPSAELRYVTPDYFRALGIPVTRGRAFTDADTADAPRVIVINQALARRYFGELDPVGRVTDRGLIVGVAGDVKQIGIDREPAPEIYYPIAQNVAQRRELGMSLIVSTEVPAAAVVAPITAVIRESYPQVAIFNVKTLDEIVGDALADQRLNTTLLTAFAAIAVVLACAGIYGVVSYAVRARTREFGVRIALGADPRQVRALVIRQAARLAGTGLVLGFGGALLLARYLTSVMPGADRLDVVTTVAAAAVLGAVACAAAVIPALRASRVSPLIAIRDS
jgi:predicted permease